MEDFKGVQRNESKPPLALFCLALAITIKRILHLTQQLENNQSDPPNSYVLGPLHGQIDRLQSQQRDDARTHRLVVAVDRLHKI